MPPEDDDPETQDEAAATAPDAQVAELTDKWLRALAELENARRASRQELDTVRRFGAQPAFTRLLAVLDNLQRALATPPAGVPGDFLEGLRLIEQQFVAVLEEHGVSRVVPEAGQPLDPRLHHALMEEPAEGLPTGSIVRTVLPGYRLHDRLLRPAQVTVARSQAAEG